MKPGRDTLARAQDGLAAVEFALVAPVLILFMIGFLQLGMLGFAKAGLAQAVEAGARYATLYPRPTDAQIYQRVRSSGYGMRTSGITGPTFARGTSNGSTYVDITVTYSQTLDFAFFRIGPIRISHTRRAYQV